eukprot:snap_masked-scaffold_17-processed-gene-3.33-mRNA-1 protein AED:1.00 eAED:1.00 QI:0/-1/0/0/-1/1/1/0/379
MILWTLTFTWLTLLSLEGNIIRISGLTQTRDIPELCFDIEFAYKKTKFLPYTECPTYEEPLLIEHFIHPASTKFINFTLLYERESFRTNLRRAERENIINTEFTNCKEYLETMKLRLDSYYSTILQEVSPVVEIIPFASIQSEELLSSSACLENQTSIDCILLHTFSTLNSTFFIQSEIEKNIPLNYSKNLKLIEDVCEGTESSSILQQVDEVANILNLGGIKYSYLCLLLFGLWILSVFSTVGFVKMYNYSKAKNYNYPYEGDDVPIDILAFFEVNGGLSAPFMMLPFAIYALQKLRALIEHINTYNISNVEISLDIGNEIKNSESGLRGFFIWAGINLLILFLCFHSFALEKHYYSEWYNKYVQFGLFKSRGYYYVR